MQATLILAADEAKEKTSSTHSRTWMKGNNEGPRLDVVFDDPHMVNTITVDGEPIILAAHERKYLSLLVANAGNVCTCRMQLNHHYTQEHAAEPKIFDVMASKVRKKLGPAGTYLVTVWGRGRKLVSPSLVNDLPVTAASEVVNAPLHRAPWVRTSDNLKVTFSDLPSPNTKRWVVSRKEQVVAAVNGGLLSSSEATRRYGLSQAEFNEWALLFAEHGRKGLRTTRTAYYALSAAA